MADLEKLAKAVETAKAEKKAIHEEKMAFLKKHKLFGGKDHTTHSDKKIAAGWKDLKARGDAARTKVEKAEAAYKEVKPKAERSVGVLSGKYEYPEGATSDEKKKIRAAARAEAKKAERAGSDDKKDKKKAPEKEAPADKKADKKGEKKAPEPEAEKKADKKKKKKAKISD